MMSSETERAIGIGEISFSDHFFGAVRAAGVSNVLPGRRYFGGYREGTRGARRAKKRAIYLSLSKEMQERLRYEEQQKILVEELRYIGALLALDQQSSMANVVQRLENRF